MNCAATPANLGTARRLAPAFALGPKTPSRLRTGHLGKVGTQALTFYVRGHAFMACVPKISVLHEPETRDICQ